MISWEEVYCSTPAKVSAQMRRDTAFDSGIRRALRELDHSVLERDHVTRVRKQFLEQTLALRDRIGSP